MVTVNIRILIYYYPFSFETLKTSIGYGFCYSEIEDSS